MSRLHQQAPDDFEAVIRIFPFSQRGRMTPAFNGLRWDFSYADDPQGELHAIVPDFIDENCNSLPPDHPLPVDIFLNARMTIISDEMRTQFHRRRVKIGLRFFCHEGSKRVAEGQVLRLTGLHLPRAQRPPLSRLLLAEISG
jgi:hypothetical protein